MGALSGRDLLLKVDSGDGFVTCAGLRTKSITLNARSVDITDAGSEGWRELLPGAGLKSAEVTGSGVFRSRSSDATVRGAFFSGDALPCQFLMPGFGRLEGDFLVTRLRYSGTYDGEAAFEMTFASAGALAFEALT